MRHLRHLLQPNTILEALGEALSEARRRASATLVAPPAAPPRRRRERERQMQLCLDAINAGKLPPGWFSRPVGDDGEHEYYTVEETTWDHPGQLDGWLEVTDDETGTAYFCKVGYRTTELRNVCMDSVDWS